MQHLNDLYHKKKGLDLEWEQEHLKEGRYTLNMVKIDRKVREVLNHIKLAEARKATLIAETTAEYLEEEKKVLNQIDNDPLLRLKADEVQIRAREEQRKREADEEQNNINRLRLIQNRELAEEKMDENDKHQKLRAAVSLAKAGVKDMKAAVVEEE